MRDVEYIHPLTGVSSLTDVLKMVGTQSGEDLNKFIGPAKTGLAGKTMMEGVGKLVGGVISGDPKAFEEFEQSVTEETPVEEQQIDNDSQLNEKNKQKPSNPRQDASIEGMDNPQSDVPEQPGTELPNDPVPITRSWFMDNYGMTGREVADLLIKANDLQTLDSIQNLLRMEKMAILDYFPGVSPSMVDELPMTDLDYDALNKHTNRLELPFRRFVKSWSSSDDEGKKNAEMVWRSTVDKTERLSQREQNILTKCKDVLIERGALNAQTLKSYGVSASAAEISSLIKSHGFLYDILAVGQFSKSVGRGLFYDVKRYNIMLKDADRFLAGLIETGGEIKLDSRLNPRIEMKFHAPNAPWYADALKSELGVENIFAEGVGIVIEGDFAVKKALDLSLPYMNNHDDANLLSKALDGNRDALIVFAHERSDNPKHKADLLKSNDISYDHYAKMKEEVMTLG